MSDVVTENHGDVAVVTINRPDRRNALTVDTCVDLANSVEAAGGARAIVLTGAGSAFSAGGDFDELARFAGSEQGEPPAGLYQGFQRMIRAVREVEVPVLAAINGHAMGAGMDLALACDLRIAAEGAQLGQVWVKVGLIPGTGGAFWTTALAGLGRAAQMILTGEPIDAQRALEWGLVNEVVPRQVLGSRALELAQAIAQNARGALAANKRLLNETIRDLYEAALERAREAQPARFASEEFRRALDRLRR